ncbi:outer membrane protein assembly factor BamE [Aliikangiella coralliicola]|uniref:Outer membrane protein assembly factor BamE n=1 Tax=Aliikangiella coralliicola TaxID=2592383 RepID=A0A545UI60_9GAMM|nr:outer membrane protein assembly factor BamE [Aliikangiella coralliicola]TQV89156.1 outer membrane protein assembly factor BamE [Aliikangiella coralliicola]
MIKKLSIILVFVLSACVYRLDIQQGNILAQKDIDKLRAGLTKNQVVFVLGSPVVDDAFADDKWIYLYSYKNSNRGTMVKKKLELVFDGDKLVSAAGDYDIPESLKTQ